MSVSQGRLPPAFLADWWQFFLPFFVNCLTGMMLAMAFIETMVFLHWYPPETRIGLTFDSLVFYAALLGIITAVWTSVEIFKRSRFLHDNPELMAALQAPLRVAHYLPLDALGARNKRP